MNSEEVISDIGREFDFLRQFGFRKSTETILGHRVSTAFLREDFSILLWFEYLAEDFDFTLIDAQNSENYCQFWKLIERYSPENFDYNEIKPKYHSPTNYSYKEQLHKLATKIKNVLPVVLGKEKKELFDAAKK